MGARSVRPHRPSECQCEIHILSDDVLLTIWDFLNVRDLLAVAAVCQRWQQLASRRALLVRRDKDLYRVHPALRMLFVTLEHANFIYLDYLLSVTSSLHTLILHERVPLDDDAIKALKRLDCLTHLDVFTRSKLLNSHIVPVARRLSTFVINETVVPGVLPELSKSRIRQLHMYGRLQYYPPGNLINFLTARRVHLTELTLRCTELPDRAYCVIGTCTNLVALRLYACWLLREEGSKRMASSLRKLRIFHMTGARMLGSAHLSFLIQLLTKNLEELVLSRTCFNDKHALLADKELPKLRVLELWNVKASVDSLLMLAHNLPKLRICDLDISIGSRALEQLQKHPSLEQVRAKLSELISPKEGVAMAGRLWPLLDPEARYGPRSLRPNSDGFRDSLFYHWSVDRPPIPLPPPDHNYENDFSLLGPESDTRPIDGRWPVRRC